MQPSNPAASGDIGHAKAKSIALNHAGVSESKAYDMEIELDDEAGTLVYEVEFKFGGMEYSYEINAATGASGKAAVLQTAGLRCDGRAHMHGILPAAAVLCNSSRA